MKLINKLILIINLYAICLLLLTSYISATTVESHEKSQFRQLDDFLTESVNNFKLDFHRSFEESRIRHKQKDNFIYSVPERDGLTQQYLKVVNTSAVFPSNVLSNDSPNGPIKMWTIIENSLYYTYLFWGHSNGMLCLADFKYTALGSPQIQPLANFREAGNGVPFKSQYFVYETYIWLAVAFRTAQREYLAVYQYSPGGHTFHRRQTIEMDIQSDFDIIFAGNTYMAISSYMKRTSDGQTLQSAVKLFEWRHTQFDYVAEEKTISATSVKLFNMAGTLYISVGQDVNRSMSWQTDYYNQFPVRGSPIYLYNTRNEGGKLTYVQLIPHFATKVNHFRVHGNNYLVFVDSKDISRIYWWSGDQFLIYQDLIETRHAIDVSIATLPNSEILLAFVMANRVQFFTEAPNAQYKLNGQFRIPDQRGFRNVQLFSHLKTNYFCVFTFDDQWKKPMETIWKLRLITGQEVLDPKYFDPLRSCLISLEQSLSKREEGLKELTKQADRVWLANSGQEVKAPVVIKGNVKVVNSLKAQSVVLVVNNGQKKVPQITNSDVKSRIDGLSNNLNSVTKTTNNLVFKSLNQTISGRIVFTEAISVGQSTIKKITNTDLLLNSISVNSLADDNSWLKINGNQVIKAHISFNNGLSADQLLVSQRINKLNVSDALMASSDGPHLHQVVTGNHRYTSDVILNSNLLLHNQFGQINGINPQQFVNKMQINQQIGGRKTFQVLDSKSIDLTTGNLNDRKLRDVANRVVYLSGPSDQVITGQWILDIPTSVNRIELRGLINRKVNITELAYNAVTIYGEQNITGQKTFKAPVRVLGDIRIAGTVNGIKLGKDVITTNSRQVITGNLEFRAPVEFMANVETDFVNGMDLSADSILKDTPKPQVLNRKVFNQSIDVVNDITMAPGSTLDGVDPSELLKSVISNKNTVFTAPVSINKLKITGGNIFAKRVNQFAISDLPHILWLKSANQTIRVPVLFSGNAIKIKQFQSSNVNGFRIPNDFVHKHQQQQDSETILGQKIFADRVTIKGNVEQIDGKKVNRIDLPVFSRQVVKKESSIIINNDNNNNNNISDYIWGTKQFHNLNILGNVIAGSVNDLDLTTDVMLTNTSQTINGLIRLMSPTTWITGSLKVMSNINVKTTVNNYSLSLLANELVLTNRWPYWHQRPIINKQFVNGIGGQHMTAMGLVSDVSIDLMKAKVVTINSEQQVFSAKNYTSVVRFDSDLLSDYLNDLKIHDFADKVVMKNRKTLVRGFKTFSGQLDLKSDLVIKGGLINGMDVQSLQRTIMSRTRDNVILAPMKFANDINAILLTVDKGRATIDGLSPLQLALIGNDMILSGNNQFNRNLSVSGDINITKTINGCDLRQLAMSAVLNNNNNNDNKNHIQSIYGGKDFHSLQVMGNIIIDGLVNGLDIHKLLARVVTRTGDQVITAPSMTFLNDVVVDELIINGLINGHNITQLFNDVVVRSRPQTISGRKQFLKPIVASGLRTQVDQYVACVDGLVNGVNVQQLNATSVRRHQSPTTTTPTMTTTQAITGVKTFAGRVSFKRNVLIGGSVGGLRLPNDLILVNTDELITGVTHIHNGTITGMKSMTVTKMIDGIDLSYFAKNRLTISDQNELIESIVDFQNSLIIDRLIVKKSINGIPIDGFVTTRGGGGRHLINGLKSFATDLYVRGNIQSPGVYNGVNIHQLSNRAVSLDQPETVPGFVDFQTPVNMYQMHINGLLNGYDISDMANFFNTYTIKVNQLIDMIRKQIHRQGSDLDRQFAAHLIDRSSGIDYFVTEDGYELNPAFNQRINDNNNQSTGIYLETNSPRHLYFITADQRTKRFADNNNCNELNGYYSQRLHVLLFNGKTYDLNQVVDIPGVNYLDSFTVSNLTYVVAASHLLGQTFILQYRGYNKFEIIQTLSTPGVEMVKVFWSPHDIKLHIMITSSSSVSSPLPSPMFGQQKSTKVMTAVISGSNNYFKKYSTIDQLLRDQPKDIFKKN
ncbi:uncharacterized protein LOC128966019 [Oppia nitens]|uniref:uncharacterized protein LOC128966019 n=1 Tax=Oppia nitens TaxID=1686743 RepID=UPI0023DBA00A|nr:uncharacterized protein LOC128966019 [Oppia nitens]